MTLTAHSPGAAQLLRTSSDLVTDRIVQGMVSAQLRAHCVMYPSIPVFACTTVVDTPEASARCEGDPSTRVQQRRSQVRMLLVLELGSLQHHTQFHCFPVRAQGNSLTSAINGLEACPSYVLERGLQEKQTDTWRLPMRKYGKCQTNGKDQWGNVRTCGSVKVGVREYARVSECKRECCEVLGLLCICTGEEKKSPQA